MDARKFGQPVKQTFFRLDKLWNDDKSVSPWMFVFVNSDGTCVQEHARDFCVIGTITHGRHEGRTQALIESTRFAWTTSRSGKRDKAVFFESGHTFDDPLEGEVYTTHVRFNTPALKNATLPDAEKLPEWRIVTFFDDGSINKDEFAYGIQIHGHAWSQYHDYGGEVGEKMCIGFRGALTWDARGNAFMKTVPPPPGVYNII